LVAWFTINRGKQQKFNEEPPGDYREQVLFLQEGYISIPEYEMINFWI